MKEKNNFLISILDFFRGLINFSLGIIFIINALLFGLVTIVPKYVNKDTLLANTSEPIKKAFLGDLIEYAYSGDLALPLILLFVFSVILMGLVAWRIRKSLRYHGIVLLLFGGLFVKFDALNGTLSSRLPGQIAYYIEKNQERFNSNFATLGIYYIAIAVVFIGIAIYLSYKESDQEEEIEKQKIAKEREEKYLQKMKEREAEIQVMVNSQEPKLDNISSTEKLYNESVEEFKLEEEPNQNNNLFTKEENKIEEIPVILESKPILEEVVTDEPKTEEVVTKTQCPECGHENDVDYIYCEFCGASKQ